MYLTQDQVDELINIASNNNGKCDRCFRVINIYRYRINTNLVTILRKMRDLIDQTGINAVNFNDLDLPYRLGTQRTKLRLHGLIAHVKNEAGATVANTWLLTKKAGDFLRGQPIPEKVVVFDNQVLGHDLRMVTIHQVMNESAHQATPITTPEAEVYSQVRDGYRDMFVKALYRGYPFVKGIENNVVYDLRIKHLKVGSPVKILEPVEMEYASIATFYRDWQILKGQEQLHETDTE